MALAELSWGTEMDDDVSAGFLWLIVLTGVIVWANWDSDNIVAHLRYKFTYGVPYSNVTFQTRPKDCDFMGSPVGMKDCRYEPVVFAYNVADQLVPAVKPIYRNDANTGKPIVSYDQGKSWWWVTSSPISDYTIKTIEVQFRKSVN